MHVYCNIFEFLHRENSLLFHFANLEFIELSAVLLYCWRIFGINWIGIRAIPFLHFRNICEFCSPLSNLAKYFEQSIMDPEFSQNILRFLEKKSLKNREI